MFSSTRPHRPLTAIGRWLTAMVLVVASLAACGGDDDAVSTGEDAVTTTSAGGSDDAADDQGDDVASMPADDDAGEAMSGDELSATPNLAEKPVITIGGDAPTELETTDVVEGDGAEAVSGSLISVQYVGVLFNGGDEFDASWNRGEPFSFQLGGGQVIQGWDQGFVGMKVGGRRILSIPSELAYGENGSGSGSIGPNEPLVFVVDLLDVLTIEGEEPEVIVADPLPDTLEIVDEIEGDGAAIEAGDSITLHYVGVSASTGEKFDSSWTRGAPFSLNVGVGQVIPGWDQGLLGMKVGGQRRLTIPPELAYGEAGAGNGVIAPNETLVFVVNLYKIG